MRVADDAPDLHKLRPIPGEPPLSERTRRHAKHGCDVGGRVHESGFFGGFSPREEQARSVGQLVALRGLHVNDAPVRGRDRAADVDLCACAAGLVNDCREDQIRGGGVARVRGDCVGGFLLCHVGTAFMMTFVRRCR